MFDWIMRVRSVAPIVVIAALFAAPVVPQETDDEVRSALEEWRDTLLYGINSQIAELLPTLTEREEADLIPEVTEVFSSTTDSDVLVAAARYLQELDVSDGHGRAQTIIRNQNQWNDSVLTSVMQYLRETDAELTDSTVDALERIAMDRTIGPASGAVRLMGSADVPADRLIQLYEDSYVSDDVRGRILIELGDRGDERTFEFVRDVIGEGEVADTALERFALDTLGKLGDPRALPILLRQLNSDEAITRAYAVNALTEFESPEANEAIRESLRDDFWRVRVAALEAVARRDMTEAVPAVMFKVRRDPESQVRIEAIQTLADLGAEDGWSLLEERVMSDRTPVEERGAIIEALMTQRLDAGTDTLLSLMDQEWDRNDSPVIDMIGRVASRSDNPKIEPIAERLVAHPNFIFQIYGLRAIGRSGLTGLTDVAEARSEPGNHRSVRAAATRALEQLGPGATN